MISVEQAQARVAGLVRANGVETVALADAAGRVLREPVVAGRDQPPYPSSAMDGYAVRSSDISVGARLRVIGETAAGEASAYRVNPGEAVRVFTGSWVPDGADRILIQEDADRDGDWIAVRDGHDTKAYIRPKGGDFAKGDVLAALRRISAADVSLIASMNASEVCVSRKPVVAVVATGDELVWPGQDPAPHQIIASNNFGLKAMLEAAGAQVRLLPIARDSVADLTRTLELGLTADLIVTMGGASVGDHDHVHEAIGAMGGVLDFHKIAMRPGKPLMAGTIGAVPVVGLPGNPVSSLVCAAIFVTPLVSAIQGLEAAFPKPRKAILAEDMGPNGPRAHYMRATVKYEDGQQVIAPGHSQDSSLLSVLSKSNALLVRPVHDKAQNAGDLVSFIEI